MWNYAPDQSCGSGLYSALLSVSNTSAIYKSNIIKRQASANATAVGVWQAQVFAIIYLRHLHSFFDKAPLMKGIFFRLTLNLNNATAVVTSAGAGGTMVIKSVNCPNGGVFPAMFASSLASNGSGAFTAGDYFLNVSVGGSCLDSAVTGLLGATFSTTTKNVTLNVPAYTFNPIFESAYISNSVRKIQYEDIYQYQILAQGSGQNINALVTNGIAGLKSCLVIPFYTSTANIGVAPIQSPFDPSGGGTTSPLCMLSNFNVVVSGQNALYNSQRYTYENFIQQLNGQNAINGNLVDGMGSSLISQQDFENSYCYYYVDVSRCLPIEVGVSKSVNIVGQNLSAQAIDLYVFLSYMCSVEIDILSGSRI